MEQVERKITPLAGAKMPADRGLSGLGLLMQMGGSVFLAYGVFILTLPMLSGSMLGSGRGAVFLIALLSIVRSAFHRRAGSGLLYGNPKGPLHQVWVYIGVALVQSVAVYFLLGNTIFAEMGVYVLVLLASWPLTLAAVLVGFGYREVGASLEHAEDMGFESAAVLMTIFGILGSMTTGLIIITIFQSPFMDVQDVPSFLWLGVTGMLFVRSILHAKAGLQGCQGMRAERASESAARYFNFGIMSSIIACAVLMLQMIMQVGTLHFAIFASVGFMGYLLLTWPMLLRNFFTDRNFSILLDEQEITRRAPDTGLTALGWLLLALGSVSLATNLGALLFLDSEFLGADPMMLSALSGHGIHSPWWDVSLALLQTVAGLSLIRMMPVHKLLTSAFGGVSVVVTVYVWWPELKDLSQLNMGGDPIGSLQIYGPLLLSLAVAVSSVFLVNRSAMPDAKARISPV